MPTWMETTLHISSSESTRVALLRPSAPHETILAPFPLNQPSPYWLALKNQKV